MSTSFVSKFNHFSQEIVTTFSQMSPAAWAVIATGTVIFGYVMLKGMNLQGGPR